MQKILSGEASEWEWQFQETGTEGVERLGRIGTARNCQVSK